MKNKMNMTWVYRLPAWLVFAVIGLPSFLTAFASFHIPNGEAISSAAVVLSYVGLYCWILATNLSIRHSFHISTRSESRSFVIRCALSALGILLAFLSLTITSSTENVQWLNKYFGVIFLAAFVLVVLILSVFATTARAIRSAELRRKAGFAESLDLFILLWFFPFGIYFLQKRVQKVAGSLRHADSGSRAAPKEKQDD